MDSFTHVPKTWAIATKSQCDTQEMEGGNKGKLKSDVKDDIKKKLLEAIDHRQMDSFTHVLDTWAIAFQSQHEAQETEDDGREVKV